MDQITLIKNLESIRYALIEDIARLYTIKPRPIETLELTLMAIFNLGAALTLLKKRKENP